jgi:hypothetical protein
VISNLIIGEMYVEPQGPVTIHNYDTGEKCELEYKARGWTSKNNYMIHGVIKDIKGKARYHVTGKYPENFILTNLETNET